MTNLQSPPWPRDHIGLGLVQGLDLWNVTNGYKTAELIMGNYPILIPGEQVIALCDDLRAIANREECITAEDETQTGN